MFESPLVDPHILRRPLPPAIQGILPAIAADGGRHRARTALAILGVGFDYLTAHLTDVDAALGVDSPGPDELGALVHAARDACSTAAPRVPQQHVISRGLLRRWTQLLAGNAEPRLIRYDLTRGTAKLRTVGQVGYVRDFVSIDSETTERIWQRVEDRLPAAIAAAEDGTISSSPELTQVVREAIALHFTRNPQTAEVHAILWRETQARQIGAIAGTPLAREAFRRQHRGIIPAGQEALRLGAEAVLAHLMEAEASGALFRLIVEDRFERALELLGQAALETVTPDDPEDEFLIGDVPAITFDAKLNAVGVREGIALTAGDTVMLPLGPRLLVALGPSLRAASLPSAAVDRLNQLQVRAAQAYVCCRPDARVANQLAIWRLPRSGGA